MILIFVLILIIASTEQITFEVLNNTNVIGDIYYNGQRKEFKCNGGSNIYGQIGNDSYAIQQFQMPQHTMLRLEVILYGVDLNNQIDLYVDHDLAWSSKTSPMVLTQCGLSDMKMIQLKLDLLHSGSSGIVIFIANTQEIWGFSDLKLSVQQCPKGCVTCENEDTQEQCSLWEFGLNNWIQLQSVSFEGWQIFNGKDKTSICGNIALVGGYNNFGMNTILYNMIEMKPHYKVRIQVLWANIDSWDNEQGQMMVDGIIVWRKNYTFTNGYGSKICGNSNQKYKTDFQRIDTIIDHTGNNMLINFTSTLDQGSDDESFGLRDLFIYYLPCADRCNECHGPTISDCIKCSDNLFYDSGQCLNISNFEILSQNFNTTKFDDLNGWEVYQNKNSPVITTCMGTSLIGGFGVIGSGGYITKTFKIPPHTRLRLQVLVYKIDSWDNEKLIIEVDDAQIWTHVWSVDTDSNYCGQFWTDSKVYIDLIFEHTNEEARIKFSSTLNQDSIDESWGFREFTLMYESSVQVIELMTTTIIPVVYVLLIILIYM
ncbi:unnamed protein product [Paramecium primaurelia]|uniref:Uncharacterized protein n=1 Tax=Paramecium primaurelia TaxID=5886 RepID=A0A8S1PWD6_PARPR|nr:unnamed protein product [Paramecium primaurelia]